MPRVVFEPSFSKHPRSQIDMLCQLCLSNVATYHLTERLPSGQFAEADYCAECYEVRCLKPPLRRGVPQTEVHAQEHHDPDRGRAVPNAIAAWVMRSGYVTGTPAQIRQWTMAAFLALLNVFLAFWVAWLAVMAWLGG